MSDRDDIKIAVTQDHINKGVCGNQFNCPIACAFREQQLDAPEIRVTSLINGSSWYIFKHNKRLYKLPTVAVNFAMAFDAEGRESVEPFEFIAEAI